MSANSRLEKVGLITFVDGQLGSGKSYVAVALAHDFAQKTGLPVFANFQLRLPTATVVRTWQQVCSIRDGLFVWDESHLDIDSRTFATNVTVTPWLTQTRKLGVQLIVVSQSIDQVDIRMRRLTDVLIRCEAVAFGTERGTRLNVFAMQPSPVLKSRRVLRHSSSVYALYDTRQLIIPLSGRIPPVSDLYSLLSSE